MDAIRVTGKGTSDLFLQYPNSGAVFALQFREDKKWIENNFPKDMRYESVILSGDNVLQPEYFQYVSQVSFCNIF